MASSAQLRLMSDLKAMRNEAPEVGFLTSVFCFLRESVSSDLVRCARLRAWSPDPDVLLWCGGGRDAARVPCQMRICSCGAPPSSAPTRPPGKVMRSPLHRNLTDPS